ncbi:hypothetical protein C6P46_003407 [Rhodotorula mucilaginosa]|uniref:Uncharacterized protein n=1 Tax=Rhodotorula mucilaginosa TaxID=5537 RepID=A0A9P7B794_RHOMI|nr:hypothetical protein C6P46_003407 [Rhodotorula mucilaginosa]TKA57164.1 hypothetical protein B0A53_01120 [Rhodotorula sp. CCFEE 5036]
MPESRLSGTPVPSRTAGRTQTDGARNEGQQSAVGQQKSSDTNASGPVAASTADEQRRQPSDAELKARAAAAVARTRIIADPSITSAFRPDVDGELYNLFIR